MPEGKNLVLEAGVLCPRERTFYWKQECYARGKEPCIGSRSAMPEGKNLVLEAGVLCPRERTLPLIIFTLFRISITIISNKPCQCRNTDFWADDTPR